MSYLFNRRLARTSPRRWLLCAASIAFAVGGVGHTSTAAIINDDFESYNTSPTEGAAWTVLGTTVAITADQSVIGAPGDVQGVHLSNDSGAVTQPNLNGSFAPVSTSTLYIQFDYKFNTNVSNAGFHLRGASNQGINLHMTSNGGVGNVSYNGGSGFSNFATILAPESWYRFTLTADPANSVTDLWDLRIQSLANGSIDDVYSNLTFQNQQTAFQEIRFHFNDNTNNNSDYYIDNVLVTTNASELNFAVIPEPRSSVLLLVGLLATGSIVLLLRRRLSQAAPRYAR